MMPLASNAADDLGQTLNRINASGHMNIGYRVDQTPMSFDKGADDPGGYSVELCSRIAEGVKQKLGRSNILIKYVPVTAESRFTAIQSGKIDILCGATTRTLTRAEIIGFTQSTFVTGGSLLSRNDAVVKNLKGLAGKRVAVVTNTTTIESLKSALAKLGVDVEVVPVGSTKAGMDMLEGKKVDAFAADQVVLIGQVISRGGRDSYSLSDELFSFEPFALAIARGDADFQLVADRVLSELNRNGGIVKIYKRWFGSFGKRPPDALLAMFELNSTPE
jgi:glutamate/aspartate transport system substrate-binding protein